MNVWGANLKNYRRGRGFMLPLTHRSTGDLAPTATHP